MDKLALDAFMINWMNTHENNVLPGAMLMKHGPQDYIGAALAVRGTLYFRGSHTAGVREAICRCFDDYESIAKEHLTWLWREEPPEGPDKFAYPKARPLRDMMKRLDVDDHVGFAYIGGKKPHESSPWIFWVSGLRGWEAKMSRYGLGSLEFSLPRSFVKAHPVLFQQLFVDFARRLKAEHGHGGFAFNLSAVRGEENESTEAFMASKMAGLDAGSAIMVGRHGKTGIADHIKTIGWLTAINTDMVEAVGGMPTLRSELPQDWFAKYDYGNGIVIQAGPEPEIAPVELDAKPAIYVLPNMLLRKIRVSEIDSLHYYPKDGEPRLAGAAAERWLTRFDVPDSELLAYKAKLLNEPKLTREAILPDVL
ncbi:type VI immunity family protein [Massilia sp. S19_KUP03_FR1]|uniref:type VI immunity family protein n=1 Tax=Massilia sp. S19_KUP03_FR1 TaxID=3025503 RepID=UPI002FCDBE59